MKQHRFQLPLLLLLMVLVFSACDKGYTVRFTNYSLNHMDSVIVAENGVVFTNIEVQTVTSYLPIKKGTYSIECITKGKSKFYSTITIPKNGTGKRSIQIDGTNSIVVLEE